ncbi:MAG: carboxymuconolactone decarboxylase family protein [Amnibacterium sp.]
MIEPSPTTEHYHDPEDRHFARDLRRGAPDAFAAFVDFDGHALRSPSKAIPRKYTELMALAVALTTQCVYCIEGHTAAAQAEGATEAEVAETVFTAAALRAGGAMAHGMMAMKLYHRAAAAQGEATR